jgi:hypothetical protein
MLKDPASELTSSVFVFIYWFAKTVQKDNIFYYSYYINWLSN